MNGSASVSQMGSDIHTDIEPLPEAADNYPTPIEERFAEEKLKKGSRAGPAGDADGSALSQRQSRPETGTGDSFMRDFSRNLYGEGHGAGGIMIPVDGVEERGQLAQRDRPRLATTRDAGAGVGGKSASSSAAIAMRTADARPTGREPTVARGNSMPDPQRPDALGTDPGFTERAVQRGTPLLSHTLANSCAAAENVPDRAAALQATAADAAFASQENEARVHAEGREKLRLALSKAGVNGGDGGTDRLTLASMAAIGTEESASPKEHKALAQAHEQMRSQRQLAYEAVAVARTAGAVLSHTDRVLTYRFKGAGGELLTLQFRQAAGTSTVVDITTQTLAVAVALNANARKLTQRMTSWSVRAKVNKTVPVREESDDRPRKY